MKTVNRIRFSDTKSPHVRCYGISKAITNRNRSFTADEPHDLQKEPYTDKFCATRETLEVVNRLLALPGVTDLRFHPYEVNVTLASVYDWSDVHEDIVQILKDEYFKSVDVDVQQSSGKSDEAA